VHCSLVALLVVVGVSFASFCTPGQYINVCSPCPARHYSLYWNADQCEPHSQCAPGSYVSLTPSASNDRLCTPCAAGFFSTTVNAKSCAASRTCGKGKYIAAPATPTSDRMCKFCKDGEFSSTINAASCTAFTECGAGFKQLKRPTATSDRVCDWPITTTPTTTTGPVTCPYLNNHSFADGFGDGSKIIYNTVQSQPDVAYPGDNATLFCVLSGDYPVVTCGADGNWNGTAELSCSTCFAASSLVEVSGRGLVSITALKAGDMVRDSIASFSPFVTYLHVDLSYTTNFVAISAANGAQLRLTPDHFVFVVDTNGRVDGARADSVQQGDRVFISGSTYNVSNTDLAFGEMSEVVQIEKVSEKGIVTPLTASGQIVVDGMVASCYADTFRDNFSHWTIHADFFQPLIALSAIAPSLTSSDLPSGSIHWYARFLMAIRSYGLWGESMLNAAKAFFVNPAGSA